MIAFKNLLQLKKKNNYYYLLSKILQYTLTAGYQICNLNVK